MNIINLLQSQLSPQTVGQISNAVGESPESTKSALGTAFPALLASLVGKVTSSQGGATELFNMIQQGHSQGGWSDSIGNVLNSLGGGTVPAAHQSVLSSILGSKLGPVADFIASRCGIRSGSATSLLGMAAPFLMGTISKVVSSQGLGASGLGQLLRSQTQHLKDALPAGLANTLGVSNLLSGASDTARVVETIPAQIAGAARGAGVLKWAWVPVLIALVAWFFAHQHRSEAEKGGTADTTVTSTGREAWNPAPSGLSLTPGGVADNLSRAISSGDWNKTIDLQGFNLDSPSGLTASAKSQISEIGSVLNASPDMKVQITGFGETEQAGQGKANAIKNALTAIGVGDNRISTRGQMGSGVPNISVSK
jgi:outer membrane protein OmpA-like peptidoglycan-associated protein